jgi:hypothetical protein
MGKQRTHFSCHTCGKEAECPLGDAPCEVFTDWLTVSRWEGPGAVSHYNFCSFSCLKSWVEAQLPSIPEVFLQSFGEDETR